MLPFGPKNHAKTEKNSAVIHAILETAQVVMIVEVILAVIIAMTAATVGAEETKAPRSTITIGRAQNAKIQTLPSGKHATDVKPHVLVAVEVLGTTEVVRTEGHNEMVADTSNVAETIGKKFTTIMIGHAESVITQISHSVKSATDVKHPALVAVVGDPVEETVVETDAVVAVDTAEETEAETVEETDAVAAVDTAEETEAETVAETVVETDAVVAVDTAEETEVETVVETDAVAAVDTAEETEVETDAVAETVVETDAVAAVDTVEETEVETDAVAAATVVITIDAHKATTQIIVMQRENAQGTLTIGDQTTSNRRRTTDTTIDWGLTT
jgi:hypothetical protein